MKTTTLAAAILCLSLAALTSCGKNPDPARERYLHYLDETLAFLESDECRRTAGTPVLEITLRRLPGKVGYTNETALQEAEAAYATDSEVVERVIRIRRLKTSLLTP